jgi:hypothetical protein
MEQLNSVSKNPRIDLKCTQSNVRTKLPVTGGDPELLSVGMIPCNRRCIKYLFSRISHLDGGLEKSLATLLVTLGPLLLYNPSTYIIV